MDEEMEGMISVPPKRSARRWPWLVGATAVLGAVSIGVIQLGVFNEQHSIVDHVSMVHGKISTILAAATEKKSYDSSIQILIDSISEKGNMPEGMSLHGKLKQGGDGKWPQINVALAAQKGKGKQLKEKIEDIFEASLPPNSKKKAEIKKAVTIDVDGDEVVFTVTPPKKEFKNEDEELKAALKEHKPEFSADLAVARNFEDMVSHKSQKLGLAVRGLEAKIGAVFAESLIDALNHMPDTPPSVKAMIGLVRSSTLRNEIYYDDDKMDEAPMPPLEAVLPSVCHSMSPAMAKAVDGLGDVLDGVTGVSLEGLPYDWEVVLDLKHVNPSPVLDFCSQ